jgi:hypothetical protein
MVIKTVADLKKALEAFPDEMIVQGWNDDQGLFHSIKPEIWDAAPAHFKYPDGEEYDGYEDPISFECKEKGDEFGTYDHITRIGEDIKVLMI